MLNNDIIINIVINFLWHAIELYSFLSIWFGLLQYGHSFKPTLPFHFLLLFSWFKTPPTRAISPKLGRRKSFNDATCRDSGTCYRLSRHSVDGNKEAPNRPSFDGHKDSANRYQNNSKTGNTSVREKEGSKSVGERD